MITGCFVGSIFLFDPSMREAGGKIEFFKNLKKPRGNLDLFLCSKYYDYWMFHWSYINGDM